MIVAQLSDTHIVARGSRYFFFTDTARYLRQALEFVGAMLPRPDAVIFTGDLVNLGRAKEYANLRDLIAPLDIPWYVVPGNHDSRSRFRAAFAERDELHGTERVRFSIDAHPVRLLGLDSLVPKSLAGIGGGLDDETLTWLQAQVARDDQRAMLIFLHHPPFATGLRYIDIAPFKNGERFWEIVSASRVPIRIVAGHVHSVHVHECNGVVALTSRSTAPQIVPEVLERRPLWLRRERPGFMLHRFDAANGFESIDYVGDGSGVFSAACEDLAIRVPYQTSSITPEPTTIPLSGA